MLTSTGMPRKRGRCQPSSSMISTDVLGSSEDVGLVGKQQRGLLHHGTGDAHGRCRWPPGQRVGALMGKPRKADDASSNSYARQIILRRELAAPCAPSRHIAEPPRDSRFSPITDRRSTTGCIPGTAIPIWRVWRSALLPDRPAPGPGFRTGSPPPSVATRPLMQRINVDLPVPDAPMIAVIPRVSISTLTSLSTGVPATYDLERCLSVSMEECGMNADPRATRAGCAPQRQLARHYFFSGGFRLLRVPFPCRRTPCRSRHPNPWPRRARLPRWSCN